MLLPRLDDGTKGVDFVGNTQLPDISYASVHVYPENWSIPSSDLPWVVTNFVQVKLRGSLWSSPPPPFDYETPAGS